MNAAFAKLIAREVAAQSLRIKALEKSVRGGNANVQIEMDDATRKLLDQMMAALDEKIDAVATEDEQPARVQRKPVTEDAPANTKPKASVVKADAATAAKKKVNYNDWPIEKLRRAVERRGGNPDRIVKGKHARGRNTALVAWLRANKKSA